jgi:pimeloyl-ACP methyl ester carboxylesterase
MRHRLVRGRSALVLSAVALLAYGSAALAAICFSERLAVDGAQLYLLRRGAEREAPVVLWVHGGPGGAERPLFRYFDHALEDDFVVAYWDQRGAGRSYDPDADPRSLTIARHLADLDAVVDHLRAKFECDKLVLLAHSWGGALALMYGRDHPEKVSAIVAIAPLISTRASRQSEYEFVLAEATERGDGRALAKLQRLGPPPYASARQALELEHVCDRYGGVFHTRPSFFWTVVGGIFEGFVTPWELPRFFHANDVSLEAMHAELQTLDLAKFVPALRVPVFFFLGRFDRHVDARIAAHYLETIDAPVKQTVWFENSAHNVPFEEPERFVAMVAKVLDEEHITSPARESGRPFPSP